MENYKIVQSFRGMIAPCCKYTLKKNYFYLIEKKIGGFTLEPSQLSIKTFTVNEAENTITLNYKLDEEELRLDTTMVLYEE